MFSSNKLQIINLSLKHKICFTRFAELFPCRFQCMYFELTPALLVYWHCQSQQFSVRRADATPRPPSGPAMCKTADFRRTSRLISIVVKWISASRKLLYATMWCLSQIVHCFPHPCLLYVSVLPKPLTQISFIRTRLSWCLNEDRLLFDLPASITKLH